MRPLLLVGVTGLPTLSLCDERGKEIILRLPPPPVVLGRRRRRERASVGDDKEEDEETTISPIADRRYPCGCTITLYKPILLLPRHVSPLPSPPFLVYISLPSHNEPLNDYPIIPPLLLFPILVVCIPNLRFNLVYM